MLVAIGKNERLDAGILEKIPNQGAAGSAVTIGKGMYRLKNKVKIRHGADIRSRLAILDTLLPLANFLKQGVHQGRN